MSSRFESAEELMELLKKQIVQYPNHEEIVDVHISGGSNTGSDINLSRLVIEKDSNNILWNISADRPITSHRKITGKFIIFGKKVVRKFLKWYVSKTFELQASFNGSITRSINELFNVLTVIKAKIDDNQNALQDTISREETLSAIEKVSKSIGAAKEETIKVMQRQIESLSQYATKEEVSNYATHEDIQWLKEELINATRSIREFVGFNRNEMLQGIQRDMNQQQEEFDQKLRIIENQYKSEINYLQYKLRKLNKVSGLVHSTEDLHVSITTADESNSPTTDSNLFDYLHFENRFRGSIEEIKERQRVYLPYFMNKEQILDIGCGRGEFIELLMENNIPIRGIDLNKDMVEYCQDRGLPVTYADALSYLSNVEDNTLGGLFLGQVIEHMTFEQIIILVELAYKKLKPSSYLIMETPNPLSLAIFYRTFYVDPTHVKPIHPLTIQYVVETSGFSKTETVYSSRVEPNWWVPQLECDGIAIKNLNEFNHGINRLNDLLYGNLDYAIIAKK